MLKRPSVFGLLLIVLSAQLSGATTLSPHQPYYPENFYQHVEGGLRDKPLVTELQRIIEKGQTSLGYNGARQALFGELHLVRTPNGNGIFDLYCEKMMTRAELGSEPGPGRIPNNNVLNAEHTWPQSRFGGKGKGMQKSDLHNLFPVQSPANSMRGNFEFGEVVTAKNAPCPASELGYTAHGGGRLYFEVPAHHKGNVARAIFYFATRYGMKVSEEEETNLKAWNRADPVDDVERARNDKIFEKQRNRNPFIDYPELVELIGDF